MKIVEKINVSTVKERQYLDIFYQLNSMQELDVKKLPKELKEEISDSLKGKILDAVAELLTRTNNLEFSVEPLLHKNATVYHATFKIELEVEKCVK